MRILAISGISNSIGVNTDINDISSSSKDAGASFGDYLKSALDSLNESQVQADDDTEKLITGETTDIHQVLISAQEAKIQMELAVEVRNKLVDAYKEISTMQV